MGGLGSILHPVGIELGSISRVSIPIPLEVPNRSPHPIYPIDFEFSTKSRGASPRPSPSAKPRMGTGALCWLRSLMSALHCKADVSLAVHGWCQPCTARLQGCSQPCTARLMSALQCMAGVSLPLQGCKAAVSLALQG